MTESEVLKVFEGLARSQGLYGRILRDLDEMKKHTPYEYKQTMEELTQFSNPLDLIMYIEC